MRRPGGYTLLETLLVVAILATIAALVAPRLVGSTDRGLRARCRAELYGIARALGQYRLDAGRYPTTAQGLAALVARPETSPLPRQWNPRGYLPAPPVDPWGNPYAYAATAEHGYRLASLGADGRAGGSGAAADVTLEDP